MPRRKLPQAPPRPPPPPRRAAAAEVDLKTLPAAQLLAERLKRTNKSAVELLRFMDHDGDGRIQINEFRTTIKALGIRASYAAIGALFDAIDTDNVRAPLLHSTN